MTFYPLRLFWARELAAGACRCGTRTSSEGAFVLPDPLSRSTCSTRFCPGPAAVSWLLTLHFPLAALAAYVLARELGASAPGALRGRRRLLAWAGSRVSSLNLYVFLQALALAPLVVARPAAGGARRRPVDRRRRRRRRRRPQHAGPGVRRPGDRRSASRSSWSTGRAARGAGRAAARCLLGAGLAAVPLAVTVGVRARQRARQRASRARSRSGNELHPVVLLQVAAARTCSARCAPVEAWWGGPLLHQGLPLLPEPLPGRSSRSPSPRAGWPARRSAARGCALALRRSRPLVRAGRARQACARVLSSVPLARWFRFPSKALLLPFLVVALLPAFGVDRLRSRAAGAAARAVLLGLAVVAALPGPGRSSSADPSWRRWAGVPAWARGRLLVSSVTAAAVALVRRRPGRRRPQGAGRARRRARAPARAGRVRGPGPRGGGDEPAGRRRRSSSRCPR